MKKVLYLIAIAISLGFTACSEDKCDHQTEISPETTISAVGNWYNEAANEECRYSADGTFYTKYNNVLRSEEIEGRWEYDKANSKLSWRYVFMGQNQFDDWKVKNLTDFSLTISSNEKGEFTYEKIVETYKLEVGNTANIKFAVEYPDYVVSSYVSTNPRLATVNSDGLINAEGEKGTAYIKVRTNQGNVWVKVIVGDDCQDLWFDYVGVISQDYSTMISTLSSLGKPYTGEDGYSFGFKHTHHDVVDITKVYLCPEDGLVEEIQLVLKESVPEAEVLAYMNSHYYSMMEDESLVYYSTLKDKDASKAIVAYDKEKKVVYFLETKHFFQKAHLWKNFTKLFGKNKTEVKNAMTSYGYSFLTTDVSYSDNGSDYYNIVDNDYVKMIGFVFNPDNQVSEFWVYLKSSAVIKTVYDDLCNKYQEASDENSSIRRVFYNQDKSLRITLDAQSQAVVYNNQKMKQHEVSKFGLYYQNLGLTHDQIVNKFGTPMSDEDGTMYYGVYTDYVNLAAFKIDSNTKKCSIVLTTINDAISKDVVVKTFNEKYVVFEKGTSADGSQYAWINGATVAESTLGIVYKPNDRMIIYQPLNGTANAKMNSMSRAMNNQEMKCIAHIK